MRSGKSLVMADLPALAEIVDDGKTGLLYPAGDVQALVNTIEQLLRDESFRQNLGEAAKSWILRNRTWQSVVGKASVILYEGD